MTWGGPHFAWKSIWNESSTWIFDFPCEAKSY